MHVLKGCRAANQIFDHRLTAIGHSQANRSFVLWRAAEATVISVLVLPGADVVGGGVGAVGAPIGQQLLDDGSVAWLMFSLR